jgi:hypothetical protein
MATSTLAPRSADGRQIRIDERLVFGKTADGLAEIRARAFGLSLSARRILIMIDGVRSVGELAPLLRPGEIDSVLLQLESMQLVHRVDYDVPTTIVALDGAGGNGFLGTDFGAQPESHEERLVATLDGAKRRAVRELNERLGPDAETIAVRIEQCHVVEELRERLREAERLVAGFLGESAAQDFVRVMRRRYAVHE